MQFKIVAAGFILVHNVLAAKQVCTRCGLWLRARG
jgi:hypothetical protein